MKPLDDDGDDLPRDLELDRVLDEWTVPALPKTLDRRVMASFRAQPGSHRLWRRLLTASIRIPLPVAIAACLLLAAIVLWGPKKSPPPPEASQPATGPRTAQFAEGTEGKPSTLAGFAPVREMNVTVLAPTTTQ